MCQEHGRVPVSKQCLSYTQKFSFFVAKFSRALVLELYDFTEGSTCHFPAWSLGCLFITLFGFLHLSKGSLIATTQKSGYEIIFFFKNSTAKIMMLVHAYLIQREAECYRGKASQGFKERTCLKYHTRMHACTYECTQKKEKKHTFYVLNVCISPDPYAGI